MDSSKIEEMGPSMCDHIARYRVKKIVKEHFEGISVIEQAQLLNMLLKRKCLRNAMTLLGIKKVKVNQMSCITKFDIGPCITCKKAIS